jgi:hypothetical protein
MRSIGRLRGEARKVDVILVTELTRWGRSARDHPYT